MALAKRTKILLAICLFLLSIPFFFYSGLIASYLIEGKINQPSGSCVSTPISLAKAENSVVCEAIVPREANYSLDINFSRNVKNKEETKLVRSAIVSRVSSPDGKWRQMGEPLRLSVSIQSEEGENILEKEIYAPRETGGTGTFISAEILKSRFVAGKYKIKVKSISDEPAFESINTSIHFKLYMPK